MATVFNGVVEAGIYGSVTVLAVLLFRLLFRKVPGKWLCLLWLLAFARLAMPFQIESRLSLQPDSIRFEQAAGAVSTVLPTVPVQTMTPAVPEDAELPEVVSVSYGDAMTVPTAPSDVLMQTPSPVQPDGETHLVIDWMAVCGWIWLAGCVCFLGYGLASYLKLKRRVREAVRCDDGAWECPGLETAFILGFLKPRIFVPMGTSFGREYILTHERSHIARGDHWWKLISYLILAVHWFNPLVWLAYLLLCRDMERACDERVIKNMSLDQRKAYSTALLRCSANRSRIAACPVAFGEISVKDRIKNVLNYRKPGFWAVCAGILALVFVAVCLMTSPAKPDLISWLRSTENPITGATLITEEGISSLSQKTELAELQQLLETIGLNPEPIRDDTVREDKWQYNQVFLHHGEKVDVLCITRDFTAVWGEINGKPTPMFELETPEPLKGFFEESFMAVANRKTSGEPFASVDDPWAWTQGISLEAVVKASYCTQERCMDESSTVIIASTSGLYTVKQFEALLDILNALPENAFTPIQKTKVTFGMLRTSFSANGGLSVTVMDGVNRLAAVIRLQDQTVELILCDEWNKVITDRLYLDAPRCWQVESDALLAYLKEWKEHPQGITFLGDSEQSEWADKIPMSCSQDGSVLTYQSVGTGEGRFGYVITDKKGTVLQRVSGLNKEPLITELEGNIIKISMRADAGLSTDWAVYYDAENERFSRKHSFVLAEYGRWIAVYGEDQNTPGITVMEMFGNSTPLKTVPLTGLEPGASEPIKAVFRSDDGQLSVTYRTKQSEHTVMIDMAIGSGMTDSELLALCRAGLERYRSWGQNSILIDRVVTAAGQHTSETEVIYRIDGDYYRNHYYRDGDWSVEKFWLQKDGEQFTRSCRYVHEGSVLPEDTGWIRESFAPEQPWAWAFDFDAQKVTLLGTGEENNRNTVELMVTGSPGSHVPDIQEYRVRFILEANGVPWRAVLQYGDVEETVHFNAAAEDMVRLTIEAMYSQAISAQE